MTYCITCRRPLKNPPINGMGPICAKRAAPAAAPIERDLFGFDIERCCNAVMSQLSAEIEARALDAKAAVREAFRQLRRDRGVAA